MDKTPDEEFDPDSPSSPGKPIEDQPCTSETNDKCMSPTRMNKVLMDETQASNDAIVCTLLQARVEVLEFLNN